MVYSTHSTQPYDHCWTGIGANAHLLSRHTSIGAGTAGPTQTWLSCYAKNKPFLKTKDN